RTVTRRADQLQEQLEERRGQLETTQGELSTATRRADQLQEQLEERRAWVSTLIRRNEPTWLPQYNVSVYNNNEEEPQETEYHPGLFAMYSFKVRFIQEFGHWYANVRYKHVVKGWEHASHVPVKSCDPLFHTATSLLASQAHINYTHRLNNGGGLRECIGINMIYINPPSPSETEASGQGRA
ncbi:MAG: hypothetical protein ACX93T_04460, partial [Bacteroidota bacterium]